MSEAIVHQPASLSLKSNGNRSCQVRLGSERAVRRCAMLPERCSNVVAGLRRNSRLHFATGRLYLSLRRALFQVNGTSREPPRVLVCLTFGVHLRADERERVRPSGATLSWTARRDLVERAGTAAALRNGRGSPIRISAGIPRF